MMEDKKINSLDPHVLSGSPIRGLVGASFGMFVGLAAVSLLAPAAVYFKGSMHLGGLELGLLVAAPQLTGSILRIPFGAWVEKVGGRRPMLILLGLSLCGTAGLAWVLASGDVPGSGSYPLILFFGFLSGCGVASFSVAMPQAAYWYPKAQQGRVLGICAGVGNLAPGLMALAIPFAFAAFGLATTYAAWFGLLAVATVVYALGAPDAAWFQLVRKGVDPQTATGIARSLGQELTPSGGVVDALRASISVRHTWTLIALYFASFGGFLALVVWLPNYWVELHGFDARRAGILTAMVFALPCSMVRIYGGSLSDRLGGERVAIIGFAATFCGAAMLLVSDGPNVALVGIAVLALAMGIANGAVFKLVAQYVPDSVAAASGWVGGLGAFGGFAIPPILGAFVDSFGQSGYAWGFSTFMVLAMGSILLINRSFPGVQPIGNDAPFLDLEQGSAS